MRKFFSAFLCILVALSLISCGTTDAGSSEAQLIDLTGQWKQVNSDSADSYQAAIISDDTIMIYWVDETTESYALYWAGNFIAPENADEPYSWESKNDRSQTDSALYASLDDSKKITYEDGQLSYFASALGVSQTVRLERAENVLDENTLMAMSSDYKESNTDPTLLGIEEADIIQFLPVADMVSHNLDEDALAWIDSSAWAVVESTTENFPDIEYFTEYTEITPLFAIFIPSLNATEYAQRAIEGDIDAIDTWENIRNFLCSLSDYADATLALKCGDDYHFTIALGNDMEDNRYILAVYNGSIVYDVTE